MEIETLKLGFQVLQFLLTGAIGVYVYLTTKDQVTNDRISKLEDDIDGRLDSHLERIAKVEAKTDKALTHADLEDLYTKINKVDACVNRLEGEFVGATRTLNLIHETLMEERRK